MNKFKLIMFLTTLVMIGFISIAVSLLFKGANTVHNTMKKMEYNIGESVVLEGDTLMIVDFSILEENYTLSNGKKINIHLGEKLIIK